MPRPHLNYFRYFALSRDADLWGIGLTAAGYTRIAIGDSYPPGRHPEDHHFDWDRGRVLDAMQIVLITDGSGTFESAPTGAQLIGAGTAFIVMPGVWHRYRPNSSSGWAESWIEVRGSVVDRLIAANVVTALAAVRHTGFETGLEIALDRVHERARLARSSFDPELSACAFAVLASWEATSRAEPVRSRIRDVIDTAERHLSDRLAEAVNISQLARSLGVGYSHFRRAFREQTGFSPWQYVLHLRLSRARRLLASTDATLEDIAQRLGFSSAFHLSAAFKRETGNSPSHWRQQLLRDAKKLPPR